MASALKHHKFLLASLLLGATLLGSATGAVAGGSEGSTASDKVSIGTMSIITAPAFSVAGSTEGNPLAGASAAGVGSAFVVAGIAQGGGESVDVILDAVGAAGKLSVKISKSAAQSLGLSVGTTVHVVSEATGTILVASGKVLAFIPNKVGEALLSQTRLPAN
jgi:hypothetical protein